jgi:hypothetical protein
MNRFRSIGIAAAAVIAAASLVGCATLEKPDDDPGRVVAITSVKLVARQAVARYIQDKGPSASFDRAIRVKRVAEGMFAVLSGDTAVTVGALQAVALAAVPTSFTPADQLLAQDLVEALGSLISGYIGDGVLYPQKTVLVREAIGWIAEAADFYAPPG